MSLVVVSQGRMLTIPLLFHQIWLSPDYEKLKINDVFDIVIQNDSEDDLATVTILYAHDTYDGSTVPDAQVLPFGPWSESPWDWYLSAKPRFVDDEDREFTFEVEGRKERIECIACDASLKYPDGLQQDVVAMMTAVRKTLIDVEFGTPIKADKSGVLRLRFTPQGSRLGLDTLPVAMATPQGNIPHCGVSF
ncbi:MAG: hypothetical protein H6822_20160 [Planctomycetaceae bacterium]|nr:hypothetical protein [Planctomycetaceae bacterium]